MATIRKHGNKWQAIVRRKGFKPRTLATRLSERAVNVHVLQQILGHADIRTTSGYVDVGEHQIINAVNLL